MSEMIFNEIKNRAKAMQNELSAIRRDFHTHPELGWMEMRTSSIIARRLTEYGCDKVLVGRSVCKEEERMGLPSAERLKEAYDLAASNGADPEFLPETKDGFTGVIGILHCGEGPTVAFRFDIDALPIMECKSQEHRPTRDGFSSVNSGVMHACGHDGHTAIGLGTAKLLCDIREQLHGTVKFIFQPAEEGLRGAKSIAANGHLDDVDYLMGAHLGLRGEAGENRIGIGSNRTFASTKIDMDFTGKASHAAASPELGNNALLAAATAILNLHAIPRCGFGDTRVNVGKVVAGTGRNIICASAHLEVEVRGESTEANRYMYDYAVRIAESAAQMHGCTVKLSTMGEATNSLNSPAFADRIEAVCNKKLGLPCHRLPDTTAGTASEDYSYLSDAVKAHKGESCYVNNLTSCAASFHNEKFDFDEEALVNGVYLFCGVAADLLEKKNA